MPTIDRDSPVPIYHQLKTVIQAQIESGRWQPGDRIPTEQELCQTYLISRSPVRQALKELVYEGLLVRRPGLGTFVQIENDTLLRAPVTIRLTTSDAHWSGVLERAALAWNEAHPEQIIAFSIEVVAHDILYSRLSAAVGNGAAPDAAMVDSVWVAGLAQAGFLYALDELDLGDQWNYSEFIRDLYASFVHANSFNDRLYGLPLKADTSLLWYRKDWLAGEGIAPPRDWDELAAAARHFLRPEVQNRYGLTHPLAFPGGPGGGEATVYNLMPFIWSAGADVFDAEAACVTLDAPEARRALQFLRDLVRVHRAASPDVVNYHWDTTPYLLASGQAAMALGGSYESDILLAVSGWSTTEFEQRIGYAPPPAAPGMAPLSTVGGTSYVILRQCADPALVMQVLKLAVRPDVVGELYLSKLQNSPSRSFNAWVAPNAPPFLSQAADMIASGRARPSIPEYFKVSRQLQTMFEVAITGTMPVEEIVRRTAEFIGAISERPCRPC
jgi:multiple sugar transport system substrate-binding protein